MKSLLKLSIIGLALLSLTSCSSVPATSSKQPVMASPSLGSIATANISEHTSIPVEKTDAPAPTPLSSPTPIPLPTTNITNGLPDPALWQPSLDYSPKQYPTVDGSTANLPLGVYIRALITRQSLSDCEKATKFTTTGPSYEALANHRADLLLVYEAPDEVKEYLTRINAKLTIKPIGLDALVFLANQVNPLEGLTHKQIVGIYTGKIRKWNQVGGKNAAIIPYQRVSNSGSQALMLKLVMKGKTMMDAPATLIEEGMGDLVNAVASYDNSKDALGYSVYYYVRNMYQIPGVKLLAVNGVAPNNDTIASRQYPYVNEFYAVIRENEPETSPARKIFDWLTGAEGKQAIMEAGYVAVK